MFTFPFSFIKSAGGGCAYDTDVCAFLAATGITDPTIGSALNTLVGSFKSSGIWAACDAIYPFVGGTATTNKFNLKDPRDLDVAYRLAFNGNWTFDAYGAKATTALDGNFADTYWIPSTRLTSNHAFRYINENNTDTGYDGAGPSPYLLLGSFGQLEVFNGNAVSTNLGAVSGVSGWAQMTTRTDAVTAEAWRDLPSTIWEIEALNTSPVGSLPTNSYYLGTINGVGGYPNNNRYGFYTLGTELDNTQATNIWTYVNTFNTALSRAY